MVINLNWSCAVSFKIQKLDQKGKFSTIAVRNVELQHHTGLSKRFRVARVPKTVGRAGGPRPPQGEGSGGRLGYEWGTGAGPHWGPGGEAPEANGF